MPNAENVAAFVLKLGSLGNVRTATLKTYSEDDYRKIIGGLNQTSRCNKKCRNDFAARGETSENEVSISPS